MTIPPMFSAALQNDLPRPVEISLLGDPLSDTYAFAFSFLNEIIRIVLRQITGWQQDLPVSLEFLPNTGTVNDFQIGVPGLIVFGIMFGIITNALLLTREFSDGTIRRIQLSTAHAGHLLGGISLAAIALAIVQMLITLGTAAAVGYRPVGSLWLVIAIGVVCSLSAAGVGFIAASFSKTEGEATAYGTALMVPLVFFCGGIFPMPLMELFRIGSVAIQPYDILPSTMASQAMKKVILYGEGISGLPYELVMMILTSIALLFIGVRLYQSRVLRSLIAIYSLT
ncbi:MAG: ABC transporter permease [Anaerolineaceae bacterium]